MLAIHSVKSFTDTSDVSSRHQSLHFVPLSTREHLSSSCNLSPAITHSCIQNSHSCTKLQLFPYNQAYQRLLNLKIQLNNNKTIASGFHQNGSVGQIYFYYCHTVFVSSARQLNGIFGYLYFCLLNRTVGMCVAWWEVCSCSCESRELSPMPAFCDLVPRFVYLCTDLLPLHWMYMYDNNKLWFKKWKIVCVFIVD